MQTGLWQVGYPINLVKTSVFGDEWDLTLGRLRMLFLGCGLEAHIWVDTHRECVKAMMKSQRCSPLGSRRILDKAIPVSSIDL